MLRTMRSRFHAAATRLLGLTAQAAAACRRLFTVGGTCPIAAVGSAVSWVVLTVFATVIGLASLRYALPHVPHPVLRNFVERRIPLSIHAVSAAVALLVGPWQFLSSSRRHHPNVHRTLGRIYACAVLVGWLASIPVALHAETGLSASAGFLALGTCWIASTGFGVATVRGGKIAAHRRWMIRSYSLTASAITLRLYLALVVVTHISFVPAYTVIAWLCWVPNLVIVELALRLFQHRRRSSGAIARPFHQRGCQSGRCTPIRVDHSFGR